VTVTYTITSKAEGRADLGAEVYDGNGDSHADGFGDLDSYLIKADTQVVPRPMHIPAKLASGDYEVSGEIWLEGKKGTGDTITDATCATFSVP
jgi:hypothetical protein